MRIPTHAVLPVSALCVIVWCLRWHFREEARKREFRTAIARELRDNDARARLREAERAIRSSCAHYYGEVHHQIEPLEFDTSRAHGTIDERAAAAMWN